MGTKTKVIELNKELEQAIQQHERQMQANIPVKPDGSIDLDAVYAKAEAIIDADPEADLPKRGRPRSIPTISRHVRLPAVLWTAIERRAQEMGVRSTNAAIRQALEGWVSK
jgi:hypothetical protein